MSSNLQLNPGALGLAGTSTPGIFKRIATGVLTPVGNLALPGLGSILGNVVSGFGASGNPASSSDPQLDSMQTQMMQDNRNMLVFQYQMNAESRMYESTSNALKARHDASMAAIHNIKQ